MVYAMPDVDGRGFKIALDAHGPLFDPDEGERLPTAIGVASNAKVPAERVPSLKDQPILEARVCQYENTSNGDFLIDLHPDSKTCGWSAVGQAMGSSMDQSSAGMSKR